MAETPLPPKIAAAIVEMYRSLETATYYDLLKIAPDASDDEVKKAYYAVSRNWHPDHFARYRSTLGVHADYIESIFVAMNQASHTLRHPDLRRAYDRSLREARRFPAESRTPSEGQDPSGDAAEAVPTTTPRRWSTPGAPPRPGSIRERLQARPSSSSRSASALRQKAEARVSGQVREQLQKAKIFYDQALEDHAAGKVVKAAGAIELALQYDPDNAEYKELRDQLRAQSRTIRIQSLITQGEQAESFQQIKQAIQHYRDAIEMEPDQGLPYFRLARLIQQEEHSERELLNLLRMAVLKAPDERERKIEYRTALAELYVKLGLRLNARREFEAILQIDPKHAASREALKTL